MNTDGLVSQHLSQEADRLNDKSGRPPGISAQVSMGLDKMDNKTRSWIKERALLIYVTAPALLLLCIAVAMGLLTGSS